MKKNKGITLIALVITVIVLLILAGVAIATLTGDNGLLQKATTSKQENEQAKELELIKLAVSAAQLAEKGILTKNNIENELRTNFDDENITVTQLTSGWKYKKYKIYEDGKVEEYKSILPEEYQQLEYIESTGTQYIDTDFIANSNTRTVVDYKLTTTSSTGYAIFGTRENTESRGYTFQKISTNYWGGMFGDSLIQDGTTLYDTNRHIVDKNKNVVYLDSNMVMSFNLSTFTCPGNMYIFAFNNNGKIAYAPDPIILYSCQIYDNDNLIRKFIPCRQISNNIIGLYDLVEGKFYTNANTATDAVDFTPGLEV